jgi:Protein of unknown function (DUF1552)
MTINSRRYFLKAAGLTIGLPFLESITHGSVRLPMLGSYAAEPTPKKDTTKTPASVPPNLVCVGNLLGFYAPAFFPTKPGKSYDFPFLLEPMKPHQKDFTIYSGLDHGLKGGHFAVHSFLSGVLSAEAKGMPEGNITIDQRAAETMTGQTRYASIAVGSEDGLHGGTMMCWSRNGSRVPPIPAPKELFTKLFVNDSPEAIASSEDRFSMKKSILDAVYRDATSVSTQLSKIDREKIKEYFNSVRDIEKNIAQSEKWSHVAKPKVDMKAPANTNMVEDLPVLYDLIVLALQNGSSRIITLEIAGGYESKDMDISEGYHLLSHHGQLDERIKKLTTIERHQMDNFARFIEKMKTTKAVNGQSLLEQSMVLFGCGMGNANAHTNSNLPIILAGGGFKHGAHVAFSNKGTDKVPLCNLYLSLLQRFGVATKQFGNSTGTLAGLI